MPLVAGTRLGPYEILGSLGAGGMGEVYRAHDGRLHRDVAIKILPASVSSDADRLARFDREARLLASLNHPNVATVDGLEASEGARFLVMELVSGRDLSDLVPMPLQEARPLFVQIAEGLSYAHDHGVVHRDLPRGSLAAFARRWR